jgi:hypothetical protein
MKVPAKTKAYTCLCDSARVGSTFLFETDKEGKMMFILGSVQYAKKRQGFLSLPGKYNKQFILIFF